MSLGRLKGLMLAAGCLAIFALHAARVPAGPAEQSTPQRDITKTTLAEKAATFLNLKSSKAFFGIKTCYTRGACAEVREFSPPAFAWRVLAFSALFEATQNESYKRAADLHYRYIKDHPENERVYRLIIPFAEAYRATKDTQYLDSLFDYALFVLNQLRYISNRTRKPDHPMVMATEAREMFIAAALLEDAAIREHLGKRANGVFTSAVLQKLRADFVATGERSLLAAELADEKSPSLISGYSGLRQFSCYTDLARLASANLGNESRYQRVLANFTQARLASRTPSQFRFDTLSQILACVDVLQELAKKDPQFAEDSRSVIANHVLPFWDWEGNRQCDPDGGFLGSVRKAGVDVCKDNIKAIADSAYAVLLLSRERM